MESQNPWWKGEEDDIYEEWENSKIKWIPETIKRISIKPFSLHFLVGPRQVGKTTLLKIFIHNMLEKRKAKELFYYSCDELSDYRELGEVIDNYYSARDEWGIKNSIILLDEITFVEDWYRAIKSRIDKKKFKNDVLIITGSSSIELLRQKELFPGRRGSGGDVYLLPIDFAEYVRLFGKIDSKQYDIQKVRSAMKANSLFSESVQSLFLKYLKTGGFPLPIVEFFTRGKISNRSIRTYLDWLKGDWRKIGRSDRYMKEVIAYILKARVTPVSWLNLARETSINSPHTAQSYVETLDNLFAVKILNMISPNSKVLYRKNKKIHPMDPFIYQVFSYYTNETVLDETIVESCVASHLARISDVYFWRNSSEVDAISIIGEEQVGFEVKWGIGRWKKPMHLKKVFLLDKKNLPLFLCSARWDTDH